MNETKKNTLLGGFVLAAIACLIWGMMFLNPQVGDAQRTLRVRFSNIDKISIGTRVNYAGKPVGEVIQITSVADPRIPDSNLIYPYELWITLDSSVKVYHSDEISIRTSGLLGEKSIAINPKPVPSKDLREVGDGSIVYSAPSASVEDTIGSFSVLGTKAEIFIDRLNDILASSGDDIEEAIIAFTETLQQLDSTLEEVERQELIRSISKSVESIGTSFDTLSKEGFFTSLASSVEHIESITKAMDQPEGWSLFVGNIGKLSKSTAEIADGLQDLWPCICRAAYSIEKASANVEQFTADLANGEGTLAKVVSDDGLYLQLRGILSKVETLMDDVNHYGVLFHLDRSWQRQRTKRANRLAELCTPQQFRHFFQQEICHIDASISRVASALEEQEYNDCTGLDDIDYARAFHELIRRVHAMEERLEQYNTCYTRDEGDFCLVTPNNEEINGKSPLLQY